MGYVKHVREQRYTYRALTTPTGEWYACRIQVGRHPIQQYAGIKGEWFNDRAQAGTPFHEYTEVCEFVHACIDAQCEKTKREQLK